VAYMATYLLAGGRGLLGNLEPWSVFLSNRPPMMLLSAMCRFPSAACQIFSSMDPWVCSLKTRTCSIRV